jgi:hypothetical protein
MHGHMEVKLNKILLCSTKTNKFIIVFQFYNTTEYLVQRN